ncbi:hypothetical protein ABZW11_21755 [Nonomuraea sp. NPDC004580]|uniref:Uncharacterized protein n=1 Tax=Nonomuraea salmonea TaxID=46181 RepID=A0ABV5P341_9ACTN
MLSKRLLAKLVVAAAIITTGILAAAPANAVTDPPSTDGYIWSN